MIGGIMMKRMAVFCGSCITIFFSFQIISGVFLTFIYQPDIDRAWESSSILPNKLSFGERASVSTLLLLLAIAIASYGITETLSRTRK
jgi:quinol-cytochrome oxidoreductase complex cytochrome b subunit